MDQAADLEAPPCSCGPTVALHRLKPTAGAATDLRRGPGSARVLEVDAAFASGGAWAGVDWLAEQACLALLDAGQDSILEEHRLELYMALPAWRDRLPPVDRCLTDTADDVEKTRYHQLDRAYRIVNGLVGLIMQWKDAVHDVRRWVIVARNFAGAQHLGSRFFAELARRSARRGDIEVVVETKRAPNLDGLQALPAAPWLARLEPGHAVSLATRVDPLLAGNGADITFEHSYQRAFAQNLGVDGDREAARPALKLFFVYCHHGYYHEARALMDVFLPTFDELAGDDETMRAYCVARMNICLVMTNDSSGALRLINELGASHLTDPHLLANMNYSLGMHHLRYAQARDLQRAEQHLQCAASLIRAGEADGQPCSDPFKKVFIDNGLAFLRARQGRPQEALDLCRSGYEFLTGQVGEDRHRLHRSVLLYNIAQVSQMLGRIDEAIEYFRKSIAMDPHYSEYHNEIANLLQEQGHYDAALEYYAEALRCSAPYAEVYFNKALCHLRMGNAEQALDCFDSTLELNPVQPQAHALRAEVFCELGRPDEALASYDAAIALGYDAAAVLVNRAVLHYDAGRYELALADMDQAIARDTAEPSNYENRAAIHRAMWNEDLSQIDLGAAERCREAA